MFRFSAVEPEEVPDANASAKQAFTSAIAPSYIAKWQKQPRPVKTKGIIELTEKRVRVLLSRKLSREVALATLVLPFTLYLLLGLGLLYLVYRMERFARRIASCHNYFDALEKVRVDWPLWGMTLSALKLFWAPLALGNPAAATKWHTSGVLIVVFFPVTVPVLATCSIFLITVNALALVLNRLITHSDNVLKLVRTTFDTKASARPKRKRKSSGAYRPARPRAKQQPPAEQAEQAEPQPLHFHQPPDSN